MVSLAVVLIGAWSSTTSSLALTPCDKAIGAFDTDFSQYCLDPNPHIDDCPVKCSEVIEQVSVVCDRASFILDHGFSEYQAGPRAIEMFRSVYLTPCADAPLDFVLHSDAFTPACVDVLYVLAVLLGTGDPYVSSCQEASLDASSCSEACDRVLERAMATCSASDLEDTVIVSGFEHIFGSTEVSAEGILALMEPLMSQSCIAGLMQPFANTRTTTFTQPPVCMGDALAFDASFGNCRTYEQGVDDSNFLYCDSDHDPNQDLTALQVCAECGVCHKATAEETSFSATTEAQSTTSTSIMF